MAGHEVHYPGSLAMNVVDICGLQGASFGRWNDAAAEAMTIDNPAGFIYRKLLWTDDRISGAIFTGRANDLGMLTDIGMVKGLMQTQTRLGPWKKYLREQPVRHPPRVRRHAAWRRSSSARRCWAGRRRRAQFRFGAAEPKVPANAAHAVFVAKT